MKINIKLLKPFSDAIGQNEVIIDFDGVTLNDLLIKIAELYPELKKELYSENEHVTDYICIFINDKPFSALKGLQSELARAAS